ALRTTAESTSGAAPCACRGRRPSRSCERRGPRFRQDRAYFPRRVSVGFHRLERAIALELARQALALAVSDFEAEPAPRTKEARRLAHELHQDGDAVDAAVERSLRLVARYLRMHLLHLRRRDVRRIAR